jgi:hypothetical protein
MDNDLKQLPKDKQKDVQLAYESLNDWYTASQLVDKRRPKYFSVLVFCWFATLATGFEVSQEYLLLMIGWLGIVGIWFGAVSFFLLYANSFRQKKSLERLVAETRRELDALGLDFVNPKADEAGELRSREPAAPFDPYEARHFI